MLELVLIRHFESEGNVRRAGEGVVTPSHEYALTERGKEQGRLTKEYLDQKYKGDVDYFFCSRMKRAIESAALVSDKPWEQDARLNEADRGIWSSDADHASVSARYPDEVERRKKLGWYMYRPPGGENWPDIELRIHSWCESLLRRFDGDNFNRRAYVIRHGHWDLCFQYLSSGRSPSDFLDHDRYKVEAVDNGAITVYRQDARSPLGFRPIEGTIVPWKEKL